MKHNKLQYLNEIIYLLGSNRKKLPALIVLFLLASIIDLIGLGLIGPYISLVINPDGKGVNYFGNLFSNYGFDLSNESIIMILGFSLMLVFFLKMTGNLLIQYHVATFSQQQLIRLRSQLLKSYQHLPYQIYLRRNSSEYVHSVQGLVAAYGVTVSVLLKGLSDIIITLVIVLFLASQSLLVIVILFILLGGLILIYDRVFRNRLREFGRRNNLANHEILKSLNEAVTGLKEIRILGKENYFHKRFFDGAKLSAYFSVRVLLLKVAPAYVLEFVLILFVVSVTAFVIQRGEELFEILPTMGVFGIAALRLKPTANSLASGLAVLRFHRDSVRRLFQDVKEIESLESTRKFVNISHEGKGEFHKLELKEAFFFYHGMKQPALRNVNLEIFSGETIGLIGTSGSGKTTLVDVLLGLLELKSGKIQVNGAPMMENLRQWRSQVAYLPQQVFLIDDKLRCNVALGEEEFEIDEYRLQNALFQAQLLDMVKLLPEGLNTQLGEHGIRLSGGQRQRVAIARAFYHDRKVFIMDESTSALDNETEQEIVKEIHKLKGIKTIIVIAHRLSTVANCDRIYRLNEGSVVEVGTPQEIMKKK